MEVLIGILLFMSGVAFWGAVDNYGCYVKLKRRVDDIEERVELNKENMARSTQAISREIRRRR